jgi:Cu2+-exporting ATPase
MHESAKSPLISRHLWRVIVCVALTLPIVLLTPPVISWLHLETDRNPVVVFGPLVFALILFLYGGVYFVRKAGQELVDLHPGVHILISLAILTALSYSLATQFFIHGKQYYAELAFIITIMVIGRWLELKTIKRPESAARALTKFLPLKVDKLVNGLAETVEITDLRVGDIVLVRPGARIPIDGTVIIGQTTVDESDITGASGQIYKKANSDVLAGTLNQDGVIQMRVTRAAEKSVLSSIRELVTTAERAKTPTQILVDRAASWLTFLTVIIGIITGIAWLLHSGAGEALDRMVSVFIVACPYALGLAIPAVRAAASDSATKSGTLIRDWQALETGRRITTVIFGKSGTLTKGQFEMTELWPVVEGADHALLGLMASLEQYNDHNIARGIVNAAARRNIPIHVVERFRKIPGVGSQGSIGGIGCRIYSLQYALDNGSSIPDVIWKNTKSAQRRGDAIYIFESHSRILGAIALADEIRPESLVAITALKAMDIKTIMLTGDNSTIAATVAGQLGIDQIIADVGPSDKVGIIAKLQADGQVVAMVGDGLNDAPALVQSDLGIAIGTGTEVAIASAQVVLLTNGPLQVPNFIRLSRTSYKRMRQNIAISIGYYIIVVPLAAGVLSPLGFAVAPTAGAALAIISTVLVGLNAKLGLSRRFTAK